MVEIHTALHRSRQKPEMSEKVRKPMFFCCLLFFVFSVVLGLWHVQQGASFKSTILTRQGGAIRAIRTFCRWAGCRKADLLTSTLGQLGPTLGRPWADFGPTLGRLWADFGPTLGRLWADFGPTSGRLWADFGPTLGRLWRDLGSTFG